MKMKKINPMRWKGYYLFLFAAIIFTLTSCEKKWKKTTSVNFEFSAIPSTGLDFLSFRSGYVNLKQFSFSGTRQKGSDVEFNSTLPEGTQISISAVSSAVSSISYDIPQGVYKDIDIKIDVSNNNAANAKIYLEGIYKQDFWISYPVMFEIKASQLFDVQALSADGSKEIVLVEDKPSRAKVSFDMSYWFGNVTRSMMEKAASTVYKGGVIYINSENNSAIFDVVIGRIKNSCNVTFL